MRPYGLPCPSPSPRVCSNSCPLSQWRHRTTSFSVIPFSSCSQSFPASEFFQWVSSSHQVDKVLELQHQSFQWIFRVDFLWIGWFDFLVVQGMLKSLLQHYNSKASIFWHWAFLMVQISHLYMTTGKTRALPIQTFVGKVMSLLFSMLSRFVIAFLPRSKHLLISSLQMSVFGIFLCFLIPKFLLLYLMTVTWLPKSQKFGSHTHIVSLV